MQEATNPQNSKKLVKPKSPYFAKNYQPIEQLLHYTIIKTTKP